MQFIQNNNIINTTQYGFLKKHNTTQAIAIYCSTV